MDFRLLETREKRVSAALRFEDPFVPDGKPVGRIRLNLEGEPDYPVIQNAGGWHVWTELPEGVFTVRFESDIYMSGSIAVRVEGDEPVVIRHELLPNTRYPFSSHATLLRGVLRNEGGEPIPGAAIEAAVYGMESGYAASLAVPAAAGDTVIRAGGLSGEHAAGLAWLIRDSSAERLEFFRSAEAVVPDEAGSAAIDMSGRPLRYPHRDGTFLFLLKRTGSVTAVTDERGEWVVPMTGLPAAVWFATVSAVHTDYRPYMRDVRFGEGRTTSLGVIKLTNV